MELLPAVIKETADNPDASVIWLHGLGANGHDFAPIIPELRLPDSMKVRFILPHAPSIPVTVNMNMTMPAWFDILVMDIDRVVDTPQLLNSSKRITDIIESEIDKGISSERIVLAGFSQGGAVAYQTALSYPKPLGGLLALSTYFATADTCEFSEANRSIPIEVHHGTHDPVVPVNLGQRALSKLQEEGYKTDYRTYPMAHEVCYDQIGDIAAWFRKVLG